MENWYETKFENGKLIFLLFLDNRGEHQAYCSSIFAFIIVMQIENATIAFDEVTLTLGL